MTINELEQFAEQITGNRITGIIARQGDDYFLIERLMLSNGLAIWFLGWDDEAGMCRIEELGHADVD